MMMHEWSENAKGNFVYPMGDDGVMTVYPSPFGGWTGVFDHQYLVRDCDTPEEAMHAMVEAYESGNGLFKPERGWTKARTGSYGRHTRGSTWWVTLARTGKWCIVKEAMIVLEGEQNLCKSTVLLTLAGEHWFSDCLPADLGAKDAMVHLQGKWICEMPELSQLKRSEVETIKAFVSRRTDKFRPPYGRHEIDYSRQCVFAGTTNSDRYLVDDTGNRRFWVVKVGKCDVQRLRADRDQLWAEAVQRYKSGEAWYLDHEDAKTAAAVAADARTVDDPWLSEVAEILKREAQRNLRPHEIRAITPGEVLKQMLDVPLTQCTKAAAARVAGLMIKLGWRKHKRDRVRGMLYGPDRAPSPQ